MITKQSAIAAQLASAIILLTAIGIASPANADPARAKGVPIEFTISNNRCFGGNGIDRYIEKAIIQRRRAARRGNAGESASFYVAVPSRPWRGLTIRGVGLHYESTSVYFREPVTTVRRIPRATDVRIAADDSIPIAADASRFGASGVECGV